MRSLLLLAVMACVPTTAFGNLVQVFDTDNSLPGETTLSGNTYTRTLTGLMVEDVTFDATLTVVGSGDITVSGDGLGVDSVLFGSEIDGSESLTFTMSISNVIPGAAGFIGAEFTGFSSADFNNLDFLESGEISSAEFGSEMISGPADEVGFANSLSLTVSGPGVGIGNFNIGDITANFVATPEPSSLALALGICPLLLGRRRRQS